ncbi:cytochrome b561 and DOMON domain-containing protein At5g47530-like [Triticum dicoccoides]|uniref:cytochrome b561 and DOMON domain-containing protein At5g47530-like n=1 Tax=Triticum dicoccoides TaxID=85692 RepID=UPI0003D57704|nr:cytochrome b561 and DOMON domain-containing protein At5g47530-like [Triticum dicoccoides]XP_044360181.1 cytochrome b561 and DOMON domain-containing protein At5g47530-like [Triticum aestivum]
MARFLVIVATAVLLSAAGATGQQKGCGNATFPAGRSFERCNTLPVLGASLHWTYHAANGTAELAFRATSGSARWVAWGINPSGAGMAGSNVFVASQGGSGAVSVLTTILRSTAPALDNTTLQFDVPVPPTAEYAAGAYTIYATVALPGNSTQQNTVWQAGPLSGGDILPHPTSGPNLQSLMQLDFLSG